MRGARAGPPGAASPGAPGPVLGVHRLDGSLFSIFYLSIFFPSLGRGTAILTRALQIQSARGGPG